MIVFLRSSFYNKIIQILLKEINVMSSFKDLRIVDNFYQTSAFFPMPTVCITTRNEDGSMNVGSYSLCFPYYIAGKDYYAMLLECRNNSNTCQNLLRSGKCAINFIPDDKKTFKEAVRLGFPGPSADKMADCKFQFEDGQAGPGEPDRPLVIESAFQVFECTWDSSLEDGGKYKPGEMDGYPEPYNDFNGITSKFGAHFILKIDKILIKPKYYDAIVDGVTAKDFPPIPVDYGYRDSKNFWYSQFPRLKKPHAEPIPAPKEIDLASIRFALIRLPMVLASFPFRREKHTTKRTAVRPIICSYLFTKKAGPFVARLRVL